MLAMSTVLRREEPFKTIFGYATLFGEDGRPMHKSWGNAIEFDEAAERMGVDVMRWMYASARPDDNILFGWHAADDARRELLVLWNAYAFFAHLAPLAGWTPGSEADAARRRPPSGRRWTAGSCRGRPASPLTPERGSRDYDALGATSRRISTFIDDLSTWYLRLSRKRFSRNDDARRPGCGVRDAPRRARVASPGSSRRSCHSSPSRCTTTSSRPSMTPRPTPST